MEGKKTVIVVYEIAHIAQVQKHLEREKIPLNACTIIPLEYEVECALCERGIPYESFLKYVPIEEEFSDVLDAARSAPRRFREHSAMRFYAYRGINLGEVFEPMLDMYLEHLGRYVSIFKRIAEAGDIKELLVPYPTQPLSSGGAVLTSFESLSPVDAALSVGKQKEFAVRTIGEAPTYIKETVPNRAAVFALALYNACIRLCIRPRPLKLYASEYWFHIESFIEKMDDVELVFMERSEIKNIPWRQLLKHRVRFLHPSDAIDATARRNIAQAAQAFVKEWRMAKNSVQKIFDIVPGVDAWSAIERALTFLIETQTSRALVDIEGLTRIMREERPDKVLLRASIGGTARHFFIATQVAHQLGIPSIELQHAGAIIDPCSVHSRLTASYLAAYGPLVRDEYQKNGYARERVRPVGSPRFDHYVRERDALVQNRAACLAGIGLDPARPAVFVAVPFPGHYPLLLSSYQVADLFKTLRSVQKEIPELQFIFKFRPDDHLSPFYKNYCKELFADGGAVATNTKNLLPLIMASDVACTGRSTLMYEIMLGGRPMILFPWQKWDVRTLSAYSRTVPVAFNETELITLIRQFLKKEEAEKAVAKQNAFLAEQYSFDGHAPESMAALLREKLLPLP